MNDYEIQHFDKKDVDQVVGIIQDNLHTVNSKVYSDDIIGFMCEYYGKANFSDRLKEFTELFVAVMKWAEKDDIPSKIIGVGGYQINLGNPKEKGIIRCMFIKPMLHGNGIGKKILKIIEKNARINDVSKLTLNASLNAVEFYKKSGYSAVETQDNGKFGKVVLMEKYF
ncbi:MAG: GNAT family N-acetyltransferase [Promethearchaeota archaeon]